VSEHLVDVLARESVRAEPAALRLLARAARGSMRDALSLADQAVAFGNGVIEELAVRQMLGSAGRSAVLNMLDAMVQADGRRVLQSVEALRIEGQSPGSLLEEMVTLLQRMAFAQASGEAREDAGASGADPDDAAVFDLARRMPPDETQLLYSICLHGRAELGLAPDEYAALSMVLLRLLAFKAPPPRGDSRPEGSGTETEAPPRAADASRVMLGVKLRQENETRSGSSAIAISLTPGEVSNLIAVPVMAVQEGGRSEMHRGSTLSPGPADEDLAGDGAFWFDTVQQLVARELVGAMTRELALGAQLVARDQGHWMLRVERESLNQASSRERLKSALREMGHEVDLSVEVGVVRDSPARRNAHAAALRQQAAESAILGDAFVQSMMRDFGAKIVPGSIQSN
jgi:DNA polymerase III subunit gamma/tau